MSEGNGQHPPTAAERAKEKIGEAAHKRRRQGHRHRRRRDRQADGKPAGMKRPREHRQQRLRGIEIEKGGEPGEHHGNNRRAFHWAIL